MRKLFSEKGVVTDIQLKYTKNGRFRHFGFIGFKTEAEAECAMQYFNNTFVNATKIQVEKCANLGAPEKPKAWSKYAPDSNAYKKAHGIEEDTANPKEVEGKKKEANKKTVDPATEILKKHKDDPLFTEFLETHGASTELLNKSDNDSDSDADPSNNEEEEEKEKEKVANKDISDLEYLKMKTQGADTEKVAVVSSTKNEKKGNAVKHTLFTIKIRGLPFKAKKKDVKQFFLPVKAKSVRLCRQVKGIAYVGFNTEKEMKQSLNKNKSFLAGRQLSVVIHSKPMDETHEKIKESKWADEQESVKNEESIAESGRIFVRNLAYSTTENDLEQLFVKYGPVTEVTVPIDRLSRKCKGFALVTYMIPENAAKAYAELDGTVFQGRMMHLLPGKAKKSLEELAETEGLTYKQRQQLQQKSTAGSSHNWNTLFLGANAVVDCMAKTYNTSKERILNPDTYDSVAVRLALGETQLVAQTRDFLEQNGICLDAFNQAPKQRSKCVILAKNLPAGTTSDELKELFSKHGELGRIVLPPSGITAIIEFMDPSEARNAFTRLAYSKFKYLPLYLEWAPDDTFSTLPKAKKKSKSSDAEKSEQGDSKDSNVEEKTAAAASSESEEELVEPEPDTTLFVKNLNFSTTDEILKMHFSKCGKIASANVAKKKDTRNPGQTLSMGYGFVQFQAKSSADKALKTLQHSMLDDHAIELKRSNRTLQTDVATTRKKAQIGKQTGTKIIVRNVPFQATRKEIQELFQVFGELKAVRLPRKMVGTGPHRGFAFVDYVTKADAKHAFKALCQSTHLFGRRLVLEWAAAEDTVEELRKRTAQHFHQESAVKSKKSVLQMEEGNEDDD
ncbi:hypothetical protein B566_EDAN016952 [Ephemera danica]|nr:hypothetical protein B566_EDAN016952 [Ephemera danica]